MIAMFNQPSFPHQNNTSDTNTVTTINKLNSHNQNNNDNGEQAQVQQGCSGSCQLASNKAPHSNTTASNFNKTSNAKSQHLRNTSQSTSSNNTVSTSEQQQQRNHHNLQFPLNTCGNSLNNNNNNT